MTRKIIAVDIDDVLAAAAEGWISYSNERWGMNLKLHQYDENWREVWGVDDDESSKRQQIIYDSGIQGRFDTKKGAREVLLKLSERYDLVITTSRVKKIHHHTMAWIEEHFSGIFKDIHLTGLYDIMTEKSYTGTKADLIAKIGADYLIDDQPKHCLAVAEAGVEAILFGDYPWNHDIGELPPRVTHCHDWAAVGDYFDGRD